MMRLGIVTTGLLLVALAPFALADGPGSERMADAPSVAMVPAAPAGPAAAAAADAGFVTVFDFDYQDDESDTSVSLVGTGNSVTWFWVEGIHTVTHGVANSVDAFPSEFDSGLKRPSDEDPFFTVSFDTPGVYAYYCGVHPSMHGTIIVA